MPTLTVERECHGWTSNREEDQNAYRLGVRDGIFGYWMTRPTQINETKATRKNYFRGFIDGNNHGRKAIETKDLSKVQLADHPPLEEQIAYAESQI